MLDVPASLHWWTGPRAVPEEGVTCDNRLLVLLMRSTFLLLGFIGGNIKSMKRPRFEAMFVVPGPKSTTRGPRGLHMLRRGDSKFIVSLVWEDGALAVRYGRTLCVQKVLEADCACSGVFFVSPFSYVAVPGGGIRVSVVELSTAVHRPSVFSAVVWSESAQPRRECVRANSRFREG